MYSQSQVSSVTAEHGWSSAVGLINHLVCKLNFSYYRGWFNECGSSDRIEYLFIMLWYTERQKSCTTTLIVFLF